MIGSLSDPAERRAANLKAAGITPEFAAPFFIFQPAGNTLQCPAQRSLAYLGQYKRQGKVYQRYQARREDCAACEWRQKCCPKSAHGRIVSFLETEPAAVTAMRLRLQTDEAKAIYRQRGPVAEFPNAWLKDKIKLRKFHVRGKLKATTETLWACLTYNIQIWIRLRWRQAVAAAA
jgi:hypothetical protein